MAMRAAEVLAQLPEALIQDAVARIHTMRKKLFPPLPFDLRHFEDLNKEIWNLRVETLGEAQAALRSPDDGKRSPVEIY
jgi:beta-N-acetylhexosaminidase